MHVPANPSPRLPFAAAVVAMFAGVVGVAHAVEFDEQQKAPQARNTEQLRLAAKVGSANFSDATLDNREALLRDAASSRRKFDARWTVLHAVESRAPLGDLKEFGIVPDENGVVRFDFGKYPQWDDFNGRVTHLLGELPLDNLRDDLVNRGMTDDDLVAMKTYLAAHDPAAQRRQATLPVTLGFARVVRKYDKVKRPVPADAVVDYLYQSEAAAAESERAWLSGLLDSLDSHAGRILLSYLGELRGTAVWTADDMDVIVRERLAMFRLPDFEQRARAEAEGAK
jgi:hypothetical protein